MEYKEQSITEHIAELRKRVVRICVILIIIFPLLFYLSPELIHGFWKGLINEQMFVYSPVEWVLLRLVFSLILSVIIIYPYAMFELYLFAKPGLYESERSFLKFMILSGYLVFLAGSYLSYAFLVPFIYNFSFGSPFYSVEKTTLNAIKLSFAFGLLFQIPLVMFLLEKFNFVSQQTLKNLRVPIYLVVVAFILNSPTDLSGFAQIAVLVSFFIMFEIGLFIIGLSKR
ncbi:MAG: twin-arginine translocase subunit TatC [Archaeoglobaceae archaeon]